MTCCVGWLHQSKQGTTNEYSLHWNKNKITLYTTWISPSLGQITTSYLRYTGNLQRQVPSFLQIHAIQQNIRWVPSDNSIIGTRNNHHTRKKDIIKHIVQTKKYNTLSKVKQKKTKETGRYPQQYNHKMGKVYIYRQKNPHNHQTLQTHQPKDHLQDQWQPLKTTNAKTKRPTHRHIQPEWCISTNTYRMKTKIHQTDRTLLQNTFQRAPTGPYIQKR
jgi:hypothetical protein